MEAVEEDTNVVDEDDIISISSEDDDSFDDGKEYEEGVYFCDKAWLGIKRNDPDLTEVNMSWGAPPGNYYSYDSDTGNEVLLGSDIFTYAKIFDWENEGHYLGANTNVNALTISRIDEEEEYERDEMKSVIDVCKCLGCNKSIECISVMHCEFSAGSMFDYLVPFFEDNCNLRCIEIIGCRMSEESMTSLASTLSRCKEGRSSVEQIKINGNLIMSDGRALAEIISAFKVYSGVKNIFLESNSFQKMSWWATIIQHLNVHSGINILSLEGNELGTVACATIGDLLQDPTCTIRALNLGKCSIDDEGISTFSRMLLGDNMLLVNNTLRKLRLHNNDSITATGWEALSAILRSPNSLINELDLEGNQIDDRGINALASALGSNSALRSLNLGSNENIGLHGWRSFSSVLSRCALKKLRLHDIDGDGIDVLASGLVNNKSLKVLDLSKNLFYDGWGNFFGSLQHSNCEIERMELDGNDIRDDEIVALVRLLNNMNSLNTIRLDDLGAITPEGWLTLANHLQSGNCKLSELYISGNRLRCIGDTITAFANALSHNRSLRVIHIVDDSLPEPAMTLALCDNSSIEAVISSNHILEEICARDYEEHLPADHLLLLRLNREDTRAETIRKKILCFHFTKNDIIDVEEFIGMDLKALPTAISWIGRDNVGLPVLYWLLQSMPSLFDTDKKEKALGRKRKIV